MERICHYLINISTKSENFSVSSSHIELSYSDLRCETCHIITNVPRNTAAKTAEIPSPQKPDKRVYVDSIHPDIDKAMFYKYLQQYGNIKKILWQNGCAIIRYSSHKHAQEAIQDMDGRLIMGQSVKCRPYHEILENSDENSVEELRYSFIDDCKQQDISDNVVDVLSLNTYPMMTQYGNIIIDMDVDNFVILPMDNK